MACKTHNRLDPPFSLPVSLRVRLLSISLGRPRLQNWLSSAINTAPEQPPAHPPTLEETDVTRHREVTSKAVSAILLITLKWFKVSRESQLM